MRERDMIKSLRERQRHKTSCQGGGKYAFRDIKYFQRYYLFIQWFLFVCFVKCFFLICDSYKNTMSNT